MTFRTHIRHCKIFSFQNPQVQAARRCKRGMLVRHKPDGPWRMVSVFAGGMRRLHVETYGLDRQKVQHLAPHVFGQMEAQLGAQRRLLSHLGVNCDPVATAEEKAEGYEDGFLWRIASRGMRDQARLRVEATALIKERDALKADQDDTHTTLGRLSELLTGVANAIKGPPAELSSHDWSDLPLRATHMHEANQLLLDELSKTRRIAALERKQDAETIAKLQAQVRDLQNKHGDF